MISECWVWMKPNSKICIHREDILKYLFALRDCLWGGFPHVSRATTLNTHTHCALTGPSNGYKTLPLHCPAGSWLLATFIKFNLGLDSRSSQLPNRAWSVKCGGERPSIGCGIGGFMPGNNGFSRAGSFLLSKKRIIHKTM